MDIIGVMRFNNNVFFNNLAANIALAVLQAVFCAGFGFGYMIGKYAVFGDSFAAGTALKSMRPDLGFLIVGRFNCYVE